MPLMPGKSKKAFSHNVEAEMSAGKPQDQALAISYNMKRKNKRKKMAEGGMAKESAKFEPRPMPAERANDSKMVAQNSGNKPAHNDGWLDRSTVDQAQSNNGRMVKPIKRPRMVPSNAFSTRMYDEEAKLQESASPGPYNAQPPEHDNEEDANKQGPSVPALKMKMMYEGGAVSEEAAEKDQHPSISPLDGLDDEMSPAEDEYMANHFANGGEVDMDNEDSIAAAIMARKDRRQMQMNSDSDDDQMSMMASGGSVESGSRDMNYAYGGELLEDGTGIHSHGSMDSDDSDQVDLSRNADEDANEEDQASFDALRKENYSESDGLRKLNQPMNSNEKGDNREDDESDKHDKVSRIMSRMNQRRQFKQR